MDICARFSQLWPTQMIATDLNFSEKLSFMLEQLLTKYISVLSLFKFWKITQKCFWAWQNRNQFI